MKAFSGECENIVKHEIKINEARKPSELPTEVINEEAIKSVKVFPNPNNGNFKISIETSSTEEISITLVKNLSGETVYKTSKSGSKMYDIDLNLSLKNGLYIILIKAKDMDKQIRILVIN
jgi:hypothetical protein